MKKAVLFDNRIKVAFSELEDGNMRYFGERDESEIIKNQKLLSRSIGLQKTARICTVYDNRNSFTEYGVVTNNNLVDYSIENPEQKIPVTDGLVTKEPGIDILLPLADCLGVVVFDEKQEIVGLLHAGRQNIEEDGPKKFVEFFKDKFGSDPKNLKVYFSPYAQNYQIYKMDNKKLGEVVKEQLIGAGVPVESILDPEIDTVNCKSLPSYSHGDLKNRFAIAVAKTGAL